MKSYALPAGVDPDLIFCGGWMFCSYQDVALGLTVARWQGDGSRRELVYLDQDADGRGRLCVVQGRVVLAYQVKDAASSTGVAVIGVDVLAGERAPWSVACLGSQPLAWSPLGDLAVQRPPDCHVLVGRWPAEPALPLGPGATNGLSRLEVAADGSLHIVTQNDEFYTHQLGDQPHVLPSGSFAAQGQQGGIRCRLDGVDGLLLPGQEAFQPRICKQPDGAWTLLYGGRDSRGATAQTLLTDVTAADLVPLDWQPQAVIPDVPPLTVRRMVETVNCRLVNGYWCALDGTKLARWIDLEHGGVFDPHEPLPQIIYHGAPGDIPEKWPYRQIDIGSFPVYRGKSEPLTHLWERTQGVYAKLEDNGVRAFPIFGFHTRGLGSAALLSEQDVLDCLPKYHYLLTDDITVGCGTFGVGQGRLDGDGRYPTFAIAVQRLGAGVLGLPDLTLTVPQPTPPAPTSKDLPALPIPPPKGRKPMKPDQELRAYIRNDVAPALEKIGVPNPAGLAQQVADTFRNARPEAEGGFGSKARDPLPTEFEFFCRVLHKGGVIANLVKECLQ